MTLLRSSRCSASCSFKEVERLRSAKLASACVCMWSVCLRVPPHAAEPPRMIGPRAGERPPLSVCLSVLSVNESVYLSVCLSVISTPVIPTRRMQLGSTAEFLLITIRVLCRGNFPNSCPKQLEGSPRGSKEWSRSVHRGDGAEVVDESFATKN